MSSFDFGEVWVDEIWCTSRNGLRAIYRCSKPVSCVRRSTARGKITSLSADSRKRLAYVASNSYARLQSMITLTYGDYYPQSGKLVKSDLNAFMSAVRYFYPRVPYVWFLEFQARGAPHVHILLHCKYNLRVAESLARTWVKIALAYVPTEIVESEFKKLWKFNSYKKFAEFWQDARSPSGLSHYAVKYATKTQQKSVPPQYANVGRFWGASRDLVHYVNHIFVGERGAIPLEIGVILKERKLRGLPKYVFGGD